MIIAPSITAIDTPSSPIYIDALDRYLVPGTQDEIQNKLAKAKWLPFSEFSYAPVNILSIFDFDHTIPYP